MDVTTDSIPEDPVAAQLDNEITSLQAQSKQPPLLTIQLSQLTSPSIRPQISTLPPSIYHSLLSRNQSNSLPPPCIRIYQTILLSSSRHRSPSHSI